MFHPIPHMPYFTRGARLIQEKAGKSAARELASHSSTPTNGQVSWLAAQTRSVLSWTLDDVRLDEVRTCA